MSDKPLTVAWFSFFPVEWLSDVPEYVRTLPRQHPAPWQQVLLAEIEKNPAFKLHIIVLRKQFPRDFHFERRGVNFHLLRTPGGLRASTLFWFDTWLIRRTLKKIQPDLVQAWGTENGAALIAARLGYPSIVTMQGLLSWISSIMPVNRYLRLTAALERRSLARTRTVTAESSFAVAYLRENFPHLDIHRIEHAPKPLFHQVQRQPQNAPPLFLFLGSESHLKGADVLLAALEQIKGDFLFEVSLVALGENSRMQSLLTGISPELRSRIRIKADLSAGDVAREFATATFMVYPSRADNSPNAVKEAVVAGLPVLASRIGGIPDHVIEGENGLLFPPNDPAACAAAIKTALRHPLFSRGQVAPATLEKMRANLSAAKMGQRFAETYQLVHERARAAKWSGR